MTPLSLTPELCARVPAAVCDPGPAGHLTYQGEAEREAAIDALLAGLPGEGVWLFAYGSLLWKPAGEIAEQVAASVEGHHRDFCLSSLRWRGSPGRPGLVLGLDAGGRCDGFAQRLAPAGARQALSALWRREITVVPPNQSAALLTARTRDGRTLATIGFVACPQGPSYCGGLARERVVEMLATGAGAWGSSAEYLRSVVEELSRHGIHDAYLWQLQEEVARRIAELYDA
jgi:cation transport protein ChaC